MLENMEYEQAATEIENEINHISLKMFLFALITFGRSFKQENLIRKRLKNLRKFLYHEL